MKVTINQAQKLINELTNEKSQIIHELESKRVFHCAVGENVDEVRPEFDLALTINSLKTIAKKIAQIKHAVNQFNISTTIEIPELWQSLTIDQVLVLMPQLSAIVGSLERASDCLPKERSTSFGSSIIDYKIANYDIDEAKTLAKQYRVLLHSIQTELDKINSTETFEIPDVE